MALCDISEVRGDLREAIAAIQKAIEVNGQIEEMQPHNLRFLAGTASQRLKLASLLRQSGRSSDALAECQAVGDLLSGRQPEDEELDAPTETVFYIRSAIRDYYRELGLCLGGLDRHDESVDAFGHAIVAEHRTVRDVPRSRVHSPSPLYDAFISACHDSGRVDEIEPMLRRELATWHELEQHSSFKDTCQLRQLETELRLAEHLLTTNQPEAAAQQYRGLRSSLQDLLGQSQIKSKTIATCVHVTSSPHAANVPDCTERTQLLEILDQPVDHEAPGTSSGKAN